MSAGLELLRERLAALPAALRDLLARPDPPAPFDPLRARRIVTTGVGSSAAHARFLAHVLGETLGLPARFCSTGALAAGTPPGALRDGLIVFSQSLSPNARFALERAGDWGALVLVTAPPAAGEPSDRAEWLDSLRRRGAGIVELPAPGEFGTLVRVVGPMLGLASALALARSLGRQAGVRSPELAPDRERLIERVEAAPEALEAALGAAPLAERLSAELVLLATDGYGELVQNLRTKLLEGMLRPQPALWDGLELAHGGLQQLWPERTLLLHLARAGRPADRALAVALEATLDRERHEIVRLEAQDAGPAAAFEHEAMFDALLLRWLEETGADPSVWPAQGCDGPLYDRSPPLDPAAPPLARGLETARVLEQLAWPELDAQLAERAETAILALGSIEQHGPHLPLATDCWIAGWLAERVASRIEGAFQLPVLPIGCASEHAAFAGTLSLEPETLERVLCELLGSLARHGFGRAFVFSAHGGNLAALRGAAGALEEAAAPMSLVVYDDHQPLARRLARVGEGFGASVAEQGQHAGEIETSILLALAPGAVAMERAAAGLVVGEGDAQPLFYPSLRDNAPSGVVGDPRSADAARADAYLEAWASELADFYRARIA
ncbi:MAG: creatininase family protein [Myxococcota bacterium]|nr:creatininase family protein [Myxococcota bacterium]